MRRRHIVTSLLCTTSILAAACTSQETAVPADPAPGASPASTTSTTAVSTTTPPTEPASTTPSTEPAATTPPTQSADTVPPATDAPAETTAAEPSGRPTSTPTEYFAGGEPDGWLYVGRWTGNDWEAASEQGVQREPTISGGTDVSIHEIDVAPIAGKVGGSDSACADGRIGPIISPNARTPDNPGFGYRSIAFEADWSTVPRTVALVNASVERYLVNGQTAFSDTNVDTSAGTIKQLVVTDLDGDGDTESLVAFGGRNFSSLLLIDADSGSGLTVARSFAEISTPSTADDSSEPAEPLVGEFERFRTLAVTDLNGDGLAEFVVHSWTGADDVTVSVNTYDGRDVTAVLTSTC